MKDSKNTVRRDVALAAALLILAAALFIGNKIANRRPAVVVEVSVNGTVVEELDLSKEATVVIGGYRGGSNTLVIQGGQAYISDATCSDKVCIHQGKISLSGEIIVCLPNQMIAKIVGEED